MVSFAPRPLYRRERAPGTHWIGGWVGPRAILDAVVKRKISSPRRESNPRTPIIQPVKTPLGFTEPFIIESKLPLACSLESMHIKLSEILIGACFIYVILTQYCFGLMMDISEKHFVFVSI
jgi:hypothetical protein